MAARKPRPDLAARNRTHGLSKLPEYFLWKSMRARCLRPTDKGFLNYGGRGITVALEWASFDTFLRDVGRRPAPGLQLDRIDNDGPYAPGNVRWATRKQQSNNRRKRRVYPPRNGEGQFTCS
jgi:hypothetical protein